MSTPTLTSIKIKCPKLDAKETMTTLHHYIIQKVMRDYKAIQQINNDCFSVYQGKLAACTQRFTEKVCIDRIDFILSSNRVELFSMEKSEIEPVEILVFKIVTDDTATFKREARVPNAKFIDANGLPLTNGRLPAWSRLRSVFAGLV